MIKKLLSKSLIFKFIQAQEGFQERIQGKYRNCKSEMDNVELIVPNNSRKQAGFND